MKQVKVISNPPYFICDLPKEIQKEIKQWVFESRKIKNHPLSPIKAHENVGYLSGENQHTFSNSYQCSVPFDLVLKSFWLGYTLRICSACWGGSHRDYSLRNRLGHFDGFDVWTNFSYKGNGNSIHNHSGDISGVIYFKNHDHPTIFPEYDTKYKGKNGTMILFESHVKHLVLPQEKNMERITLAFNINRMSNNT
jgi:hypothetical protein